MEHAIVILDGYTINPGDNPWTPVEALGNCTIYDRTPPAVVTAYCTSWWSR